MEGWSKRVPNAHGWALSMTAIPQKLAVLLATAAMSLVASCASAQTTEPTAAPDAAATEQSPPPATQQFTTTSDYVIGPGDTIQVFVWRNPELSVTVPVRPDGKISTPLIEDVVAVGRKPSELAREMESRLSEYVRSPQVSIIVTNPVSVFNQVKVIGQVGNPAAVPYREGMTLLDLILASGGLTAYASGNRAKLLRKDENGKEITMKVRLKDLVQDGDLSKNVALKPGDILIVPESFF
jgi:polysaccharide biosynthesis/export protein